MSDEPVVTLFLLLNALLSSGAIVYLIRVEHRFTRLETLMRIVLGQLHIMEKE